MTELFRVTDIVDDLTVGIFGSSNIVLQWSPATGAVAYNVYRRTTPDAVESLVATTTNALWMDIGALDQPQSYYRVTVVR